MPAAARRLWLYGFLLLLPALAVGGLALSLLAREHSRLAEREQAAIQSRRAAVETRARLIAENIELLVGDVQSALMTTLLEAPAAEPRAFLVEWQATNPLVREVFRATAEGRPVWGAAGAPLRGWLAQGPPWSAAPAAPAPTVATGADGSMAAGFADQVDAKAFRKDADARRNISDNVSQYQRARQEIQEVAKVKNYADVAAKSDASPLERRLKESVLSGFAAASSLSLAAAPAKLGGAKFAPPGADAGAVSVAAQPFALTKTKSELSSAPDMRAARAEGGARSGWSPWRDATGPHLFGWRELPDRTVVGLELQLDAIKARLGEVFPIAPGADEAYALRDASGRDWHRVGDAGLPLALAVPLAGAALPGWTVVGHALTAGDASFPSGGFFVLGAALIGLLVLAILGAGALLLRQARLSEAEAALKTSFVANVSHELKTPLTTIRHYAELIAQGRVREPSKQADYLATIGRETERLARLVGNVLDFSRLEQGKKKYERTAFDLAAELRRLADTHGPRLASVGLALRTEVPETRMVSSDRDAVEQIVLNLFDNVCKYAADGGEATLRLEDASSGGGVRVVVADRGPGVPANQRECIFEKFHRVDESLTAEKGGAGLGLSIARQLARGLGGDLVCAARVGGGAEFVLTLPPGIFP